MNAPAGSPIRNWTLRRRLTLLIATAAVAVGAAVGLTTYAVVNLNSTLGEQVKTVDPAAVAAEDLFNGLLNQETAVRGYVLSHNIDFLAPFRSGRALETGAVSTLRDLLKGEPTLNRSLSRVLAAVDAWQAHSALPSIVAAEAGDRSASSAATDAAGKRRFDLIRVTFDNFRSALKGRQLAASNQLNRADFDLVALLGLGLAILLVALELIWIGMRRWVAMPIGRLEREVRAVADGDVNHRIVVAGPPELRALGEDVDSMRRSVVGNLETLAEAHDALDEQAAALRRSNADLEQFAYVASHDLQEPLRKIGGFSELLLRRYDNELDERGAEYLHLVADAARRMQELINDILQLSRIGRVTAEVVPVDCGEAARSAVAILGRVIQDAGATVTIGDLPTVLGNRALVVALFQNLIDNSLKFHGTAPPEVHIGAVPDDAGWRFSVSDNGIGIGPEHAERVFAMFQRLHSREEYSGTGIGLALCTRIVEHLGGRIWLDTSGGAGTTISWTLPRAAEAEAEAKVAEEKDEAEEEDESAPAPIVVVPDIPAEPTVVIHTAAADDVTGVPSPT